MFVGRVIAVVEGEWVRERLRQIDQGLGSTVALLAVEQLARGPARPVFAVTGGTGQGDCKLDFVARDTSHGR